MRIHELKVSIPHTTIFLPSIQKEALLTCVFARQCIALRVVFFPIHVASEPFRATPLPSPRAALETEQAHPQQPNLTYPNLTMSEPGPESVPTSADRRSKRPVKRRAINTPQDEQASQIESLFRDPSREVKLPDPSLPKTSTSLPPPPEIVANVQGSSAGAGSGEFHVYKASRRREYERLRLMQSEVDKEKGDDEWVREREETRKKDDEKTEKNRKRREKRNAAKKKKDDRDGAGVGSVKASNRMAVDADPGVHNAANDGGVPPAEETPGVIIHDD